MQISVFHFYSYGIVAEAKDRNSKVIHVFPTEVNPFFDGEVKADRNLIKDEGVDADGRPYVVETEVDNVIEATWLALHNTNRRTAPDVQRGEYVLLYQTGDNDKYYWVSDGQKDGLRKLESVVFAISNNTDPSKTELDLEDCYFFSWSTHDKMLVLRTSKTQGEPFIHTISLDTAAGFFKIQDDVGTEFFIDHQNQHIRAQTADGGVAELKKRKFRLEVDDIDFKYKKMNWDGPAITSNATTFKENGIEIGGKSKHTSTAPGTPTSVPV